MGVRSSAACVLLAAALLTGCGSVDRRGDAAAAVALRFLTAAGSGDGAAACAVLAPDTAAEVAGSAGEPCPRAIVAEDLPEPGEVRGTAVYGQWAQVRLTADTVFLGSFPGGWRVVAAGCTPQGERPYDCSVQGG